MGYVIYWLVTGLVTGGAVLIFSHGVARKKAIPILFSFLLWAFVFFIWGFSLLTMTDDNPCGGGGCDGPAPRIWAPDDALWVLTPPILIGGTIGAAVAATRGWGTC